MLYFDCFGLTLDEKIDMGTLVGLISWFKNAHKADVLASVVRVCLAPTLSVTYISLVKFDNADLDQLKVSSASVWNASVCFFLVFLCCAKCLSAVKVFSNNLGCNDENNSQVL